MSKAAKVWLITAGVLTVLGGGVFTGALAANRWDLNTVDFKTQTYEVSADFKNIKIDERKRKIKKILFENSLSIIH